MKVNEPAREIDVVHDTDVLVVGSGPGGLAAAIGAARAGVSVALLERFGCFSGNITAVGVEGFAWYRHEDTIDSEGVEVEERAKAMGATTAEPQSDSHSLDAEAFKWVADALVEEAGITPMLHRLGTTPILNNDYNITPPEVPFGGYKQSGVGRENGLQAIERYTQVKTIYANLGDVPATF